MDSLLSALERSFKSILPLPNRYHLLLSLSLRKRYCSPSVIFLFSCSYSCDFEIVLYLNQSEKMTVSGAISEAQGNSSQRTTNPATASSPKQRLPMAKSVDSQSVLKRYFSFQKNSISCYLFCLLFRSLLELGFM